MATDIQVRGFKKVVLSRLASKLNCLKAEDSKDDAKSTLVELNRAFTAFEEAHNVVCTPKTDLELMDEDQNFLEVEEQYTQCLNNIKPLLNGDSLVAAVHPPPPPPPQHPVEPWVSYSPCPTT